MDTSIINSRRATRKEAWRKQLHDEYNELTRAWEWVRELTPVTEEEMDELAHIVDKLLRYDSSCPSCRMGLFHTDDEHRFYAYREAAAQ